MTKTGKAAGGGVEDAASDNHGFPPAGFVHSMVDRSEPEAGFLLKRLQAFLRARAQHGPLGTCWFCGRRTWWRSAAVPDVVRCGFCSPPAPGVAVEWLGDGGAISGEMPGPGHNPGRAIGGSALAVRNRAR
jgi:hypothetical protein